MITTMAQDLLRIHLRLMQETHARLPLPPPADADLCLRCQEYPLWPEPHRALNNLSKNPTAYQDADGYVCPLCGLEESQRAIRKHLKSLSQKEPTND